ncbi:MAG: threonine--tRNA ligase, partial [Myxococcales bacterium]|nr:threonine--tRNA ligase [Myxococcales bacterium]
PYCIHRAPLGTHERFIAFLIEHYGGAFPTWLAPVQVRLVPVADNFVEHANKLRDALRNEFVRVEVDDSNDTLNKKIRNAVTQKIPNICVIGEREMVDNTVTLRRYGEQRQESMPFDTFAARMKRAIATRSRDLPE